MNWNLFIDDIRLCDKGCILAKTVEDAIDLINKNGFPNYISFDHDLGDNKKTGKDFVNIICENVLDKKWTIPEDFTFQVHSDNPVGSENIRNFLNQLLNILNINFYLERCQPYSSR
jgi:hypothetical protein